ncbi:MAG: hypothetical protein EAX95_08890, partial [Candidatus Thorarchaeota archaeon]|nr:hypothetical protein [Candidatus Thorarchaeota archaeon]
MTVMDDFVSDSSGKSLRSQFTQRQKTVLRNLVLATALFAFSLLGIYFSIASGLLLVLMCGALLRIILLGDPCWTPYSLDNILTGFVESFMLSALLLAPLAYIAPFLFGKVNFLLMVYVITIILVPLGAYLLPKETPSEGISKEKAAQADMGSSATAWITIILWISLGILDLAYSFHMYYGSFADAFFMFGDLANSLTIIQSIATGIYPTPNLTFLGSTLSENPITLTLSFGYSAVLMTAMNLQGYGDLFVILIKMIMHSAVVPVVYYAVRSVSARVPAWVMVVSTLGLGVTMDLTPLFRFLGVYDDDLNYTLTNEMYRGVYFPWDTPDGVPADFFAPGLGYESALASFHHLLPLLFFVFIIALLLQMTDWRSGTAIAILIGLVELPFFHIGIGFFPLVSVGIVVVSIMLLRLISRAHIRPRFLVYKALVVLGIVGLFIVRGIVSGLVVITPRFTGTAILDALGAYLGPFLLLGAIGYIALHFLPESPGKWLSIVWLEFTLLSTLLFSMARDSGIGYMPTDYFPLFNLQTSLVLAFALGVSYWSSNRGQALKSLDQSIGPRKWWRNLKDLNQSLRLRAGVLTRHS